MPAQIVPHFTEQQQSDAESQIVEQSRRIDFYLTEYSVELLAKKMDTGEFVIPAYQREDTWEDDRKSRFIESLLMGLPIPFLFFWEQANGKLEIVDGCQRLRTIQQFVLGDFALGDELETLTALQGMRFRDLPESRRRKINNRSVRGIVLNEHADEQSRFEIFDRINTGSKIANQAEVRRGALVGPFLDLVIELTKDEVFVELAPIPPKNVKLREREELVTRFFAYGDGLEGYRDRPSDFLFQYAKKMNARLAANLSEVEQYRNRFQQTMNFVKRVFPYGFRRRQDGTATPRARFEAIAIGSYQALRQRPELGTDSLDVQPWFESDAFTNVLRSDSANAIAKLRGRIEFVQKRLLGE